MNATAFNTKQNFSLLTLLMLMKERKSTPGASDDYFQNALCMFRLSGNGLDFEDDRIIRRKR